ncbi:C-terminal-binding protein-like Protein [Aphelenchoides fujianensis]|nr:C-terminal-binding protein-like Protein [Aphelenchoides fujianensis]
MCSWSGRKTRTRLFCLLTDKVDEELLDKCPQLKVIGSMAAGHDHIDVDACKRRSIKVGYTPNVLTEATAELAVALLLATSRRLLEANRSAESGGWTSWQPYYMTGKGLHGSTVGIYGLGTIGKSIAEKLEPFKPARILYHNRKARSDVPSYEYVDFDRLLAQSDFLVVSAAATPENKEIFNAERFGRMKKDAIFCNISRGSLVKTEDLVSALKNGQIGAAGLDVVNPELLPTDHPLFRLCRTASSSRTSDRRRRRLVIKWPQSPLKTSATR